MLCDHVLSRRGSEMNVSYVPDYGIIIVALIFSLVGVLYVRKSIYGTNSRDVVKEAAVLLPVGLLFVLVSTSTNSFIDNQWSNNYIVSFLFLKTVNNAWYFRHICAVGYIFIILAIEIIIMALLKKQNEI